MGQNFQAFPGHSDKDYIYEMEVINYTYDLLLL